MKPKHVVKTMDELMERVLEFAPCAEPYVDDDTGKVSVDMGFVENVDGELEMELDENDFEYAEDDEVDDEDEEDDQ